VAFQSSQCYSHIKHFLIYGDHLAWPLVVGALLVIAKRGAQPQTLAKLSGANCANCAGPIFNIYINFLETNRMLHRFIMYWECVGALCKQSAPDDGSGFNVLFDSDCVETVIASLWATLTVVLHTRDREIYVLMCKDISDPLIGGPGLMLEVHPLECIPDWSTQMYPTAP
jgi:hypothetical protein